MKQNMTQPSKSGSLNLKKRCLCIYIFIYAIDYSLSLSLFIATIASVTFMVIVSYVKVVKK